VKFSFPPGPQSGKEVVALNRVGKDYGERKVLNDVNFTIERGERIALIGPNGAGKSTLLRIIAHTDSPTRGAASHGVGVRQAYFAQNQPEHLAPENSVFEEVYQAAPAAWDTQSVRDLLGRFLFSGEDQFKPVAGLSGGERSRVALTKLLLRPSNLLLLDEPTNHLDITTRDRLEETLAAYPGTLVFVTHDRYLVDRLATQVVEVGEGTVHVYRGNYADYRRARAAEAAAAAASQAPSPAPVSTAAKPAVAPPAPKPGRESRRAAAELREVERQVAEAEGRLKEVEALLSDPAKLNGDLHALTTEHAALSSQVATLTARWEELVLAAEGAA
jgi:ATP-binding cassette subfamily F protein 3